MIVKIKEKHWRLCYQNILTFINRGRGKHKVEMDNLVKIMMDCDGMMDKNIVVNKGKEGKESFNLITEVIMES